MDSELLGGSVPTTSVCEPNERILQALAAVSVSKKCIEARVGEVNHGLTRHNFEECAVAHFRELDNPAAGHKCS